MANLQSSFSVKIRSDLIEKFKNQATKEGIKQGKLFEKMLNVYLGNPIEKETIPFNINLFWRDNINENGRKLNKTIYSGYGVPIYISPAFKCHGRNYYGDVNNQSNSLDSQNYDLSYQLTEMTLNKNYLSQCSWYSFDSKEKIQCFREDFKIDNPADYHYMSAFRAFKEIKGDSSSIMINEQMYLINNEMYNKSDSEGIIDNINQNSNHVNILDIDDFDLAVSTLYKIDDGVQGEKVLKLNRQYLDSFDVSNLKHAIKPRISKDDPDLENTLKEYAIFDIN